MDDHRLLETAERCYRLARGITDQQAIEALLRLAEECEQRRRTNCVKAAGCSRAASISRYGKNMAPRRGRAIPMRPRISKRGEEGSSSAWPCRRSCAISDHRQLSSRSPSVIDLRLLI